MTHESSSHKATQSHLHYQMWDKHLTHLNEIWDLKELQRLRMSREEAEHASTGFHSTLWDQHLLTLNQTWHVDPALTLEPPASLPGKLIFPLKKMVMRWIQPLIEAVAQRQNETNARLVQTCNGIVDAVNTEAIQRIEAQKDFNARFVQAVNGLIEILDSEFKRLRREYEELQMAVWTFERRKEALEIDEVLLNQKLEQALEVLRAQTPQAKRKQQQELPLKERQADYAYTLFEDRYRGDEATIKQRQTGYLHYFEGCANVLDIGCGRGEFLELLQECGISGYGVDVNQTMVEYCRKKGLQVEEADVIAHLQTLEENSVDGMFIAQMVEHCSPPQLHRLLQLCFAKLQPQTYLVIETQNPTSLYALSNFYRDLSHQKPIHPDALEFLLKTVGFQETRIEYTAPFPAEHLLQELQELEEIEGIHETLRANLNTLNSNIRQLNSTIYGCLDYAIIAKKVKMF